MRTVLSPAPVRRLQGLTLVELLVVLTLVGLLVGLAAPSMRDLLVRNRSAAAANELTATILRARNEAVNVNTCVVVCAVAPFDPDARGKELVQVNGPEAPCIAGADWSGGWIAYREPACDATSAGPNRDDRRPVLAASGPVPAGFTLVKTGLHTDRIVFSPTGTVRAGDAGRFDLRLGTGPRASDRGICLNPLGRTRIVPAGSAC